MMRNWTMPLSLPSSMLLPSTPHVFRYIAAFLLFFALSFTHTLEALKKNFGSVECGARGGEKVNCQSSWNEIQASIVYCGTKKTQVAYPMESKQFLLTPYLFFIFSPSILRRQYRARVPRGRSQSQHLHYHCAIVHCHTIESLVSLNVQQHTYTTMHGNCCCRCKYVIHKSTCEKLMWWKNNTDKTQYKNINFSHFR